MVLRFLFAGLLAGVLAACGGGGGSGDPGFIGGPIDDPGTGDPGDPGTGDPGVGDAGTLTIELTDTDGNPTNTISNTSPGIITLTFTDSSGSPGVEALVNATTTVGLIDPPTGLTNENGVASFVLEANNESGAGTVTATLEDLTTEVNFQISSPSQGNNVLALALTDSAGNPVTNITGISPGTLTVTASDAFGQPIANEIISAEATLGAISPGSGTALTDLNGVATFTLSSDGNLGAGTVTASLGAISRTINYQVGEANLRIGRFDGANFIEGEILAGATTLPAAGSTSLQVSVVDSDDNLVTSTVPVQFSSGCASLSPPLAEISAEVNTVNGRATSTYTASGCTGTDTVNASIVQGNSQAAAVTLTIATADVNSVAFVGAEPAAIALKGTGGQGRLESSSVSFQVLDNTGAPATGVDVSFELSTTIGGLSLTNDTATTNQEGIARAIVLAGDVSTSVRVTATIDVGGTQLSTVSDQLVVSTGLPDQNSISMGPEVLNPGGGGIDGVTTTVTVRMADKFNNPVPNGTVAFFTTEFGAIDDSCVLQDGACVVTWNSQQPRLPLINNGTEPPDDFVSTIGNRDCPDTGLTGAPCPSSLGPIYGARSAVTVIAVGEESFIDENGNGVYDVGEPFEDLPEAWLDKNENGQFDNTEPLCAIDVSTATGRECAEGQEEIFFDFDQDGVYDQANGLYNGSLCPQALADAGQCSRELVHVRARSTIVMSGPQTLTLYEDVGSLVPHSGNIDLPSGGNDRSFVVSVSDIYNNLPSAGATVSVSADGCEILGGEATVASSAALGAFDVGFVVVNQTDNTSPITGSIEITLEGNNDNTPNPLFFTCSDAPN